ncbi:hypothetical protein [Bifidobacterium bombi]|uniref:UDP-N-acetylmuramyl peptide synthase n=1 Tax=Bifidobacterium bombi DSM 19703 TaxID=1341695 RepID=A0A080N2Q0_9BIFI|nr:hypothetical protein [Bifidobacterium bombi]KFF31277.1 hypothetical protein BBOMB_0618 [Bifidobacterium bombi DSM 19703]
MSMVNEAISKRLTLGAIAGRYGFELDPPYARSVSVTSLADDPNDVRPGALYVPKGPVSKPQLEQAQFAGAYAAMLPTHMRGGQWDIPVLLADPSAAQIGRLASQMAGDPGTVLAVFVVCGEQPDESQAQVDRLAEFLHTLGNPVGRLSASGSLSLERPLSFSYPLGVFDVQRALSICLEDGVNAVVISADDQTLGADALQAVNVDVLGCARQLKDGQAAEVRESAQARYGFTAKEGLKLTTLSPNVSWLAPFISNRNSVADPQADRRLAFAVSMAYAAGVKRSALHTALRMEQGDA